MAGRQPFVTLDHREVYDRLVTLENRLQKVQRYVSYLAGSNAIILILLGIQLFR